MAKKTEEPGGQLTDYRYIDKKRKYITPAGLASQGKVEEAPKLQFEYNPHLPPVLRFDETGQTDKLPELLEKALRGPLTEDEANILSDALKKNEPWLEWTGKREKKTFEVDPVALHIHERVSTQAILKVAKRENVQRDLFADPEMEYREAIKFYQHEMDWANRLILGDSLQVMASLAYRENLSGQVQMIYFDPPYGIKFSSNFQPELGRRDVKESDTDLTREPEVVKAYRDTWTLGIHSYLSYLRDRFILARTLLKDTGSIFVQISDENIQNVRLLMDDVFKKENFVSSISFKTSPGDTTSYLPPCLDYILWYCKDFEKAKIRKVFLPKIAGEAQGSSFDWVEFENGFVRPSNNQENETPDFSINSRLFRWADPRRKGKSEGAKFLYQYNGKPFEPGPGMTWKTSPEGLKRLECSDRLGIKGKQLNYKRFLEDFPLTELLNMWADTMNSFLKRNYVVETNPLIIKRCLLMATEPGDIVLDPTCGSGTTAFISEQLGRRWITIDTSRVAIALARQRLLTSKFDHFQLIDPARSPSVENPFQYETVSHITLESIANNLALDPIFTKYDQMLDNKLLQINELLQNVDKEIRSNLLLKLQLKQKQEGKKSTTEADERRWKLPPDKFEHWDIPFDTDELYPIELKTTIEDYCNIWSQKMNEVNACIKANAEQVELVDKPEKVKGVIRVSGPFTVEGVMPVEFNLDADSPIQGIDEELETFDQATNAVSFIENIFLLLKREGVVFPGNRKMGFNELRLYDSGGTLINFEGEWMNGDKKVRKVGVSVGPQHGPITGWQVENVIRIAYKHGFDDVVFAGLSFTAEATAAIEDETNPNVKLHLTHISNDIQMGDLLKSTGSGQIFTVMGSPRIKLLKEKNGSFQIKMDGVDIYDPVGNVLIDTGADKVAAWFIDSDYDGRTFCITQAFFPDRDAWKKLEKALKGVIDPDKFEAFSGTLSLPFPVGEHKKAAVKVIDQRGNEVMKVLLLDKSY